MNLFNKSADVFWIVLTIAIHLNIDIIAKLSSIFMTSLNCTTNAQILRQIKHIKVILYAYLESLIRRPVIDHKIVIAKLHH